MAEIATTVVISIVSKFGSSEHKKHFPGDKLTAPFQITRSQANNILHVAARYKEINDVENILESHRLLAYEANAKGDTPLHIAARLGKLDVATCLVQHAKRLGAEAEYRKLLREGNNKGNTALHEAVLNGYHDIADLLINEDQTLTSFKNKAGESPLFLAVDGGFEKIALRVLGTFPNCSVSGRNGMTVMHAAVIRAQSHFVGKLLKKFGSEILEIPDDFGWMPHQYAAKLGVSRIFKSILKASSSLAYIRDKEFMSPLHIAAKTGQTDVIKALIAECPDVCEFLDRRGRTALHVAVEHKQVFALYAFLDTVAFDDLLNDQDDEGNTALHLACMYGHYKIIIPLLADPRTNKRTINNKGLTAFDIISRSSVLGPFDKLMIKSGWKIKNPNSLLEATAVTDTKERQKTTKSPKQEEAISVGKRTKNGEDENVKGTAGVNLVVATIIASITFTAGMAMPGGYDGSTGLAHLRKNPSFRFFLTFDSLAFGCSAASMVTHFAVSVHMKLRGKAYKYPIQITTLLTFLSVTLTVLTFVMGTYTVLYEKRSGFSSKSGFGLPGNIAFAAFLATLIYFFVPLFLAFRNYVVGGIAPSIEVMSTLVDEKIFPLLSWYVSLLVNRINEININRNRWDSE